MKEYTITVNGHAYQVTVEEGHTTASAPAPSVTEPAKVVAPAAPVAAPAPTATQQVDGVPITASVPGKIVRLEKQVGDTVSSGDAVLILEAMKMEIPVVAPQDGTIKAVLVSAGASVEAGDVLATLS